MQERRTGCAARHICQEHTEDSILAAHGNQPYEKVEQGTHRDYCMAAEDTREYGIVDHVLTDGRVPNPLKEQLRNDDDTAAPDRRRAQAGDGHPTQ